MKRLLLQPTSFSPAFDLALQSLVEAVHDPIKDDITNKQCASLPLSSCLTFLVSSASSFDVREKTLAYPFSLV